MTMPNFYIAGGARCGSTSLEAYCRAHPQIFMSNIKEPNYFSYGYGGVPYAGPARHRIYATSIKNMATYQALFKKAGDATAIGEASINYMLHPEACVGIKAETPDAKLVFILRQPIERAWSSFQRSRYEGIEPDSSFVAAWRDDGRRRAAGHWANIHRFKSLYGKHLESWFNTFPREQIRVILFDDLKRDADAVMRGLYTFLGVDTNFQPDTSVIHYQSGEISNVLMRQLWQRSSRLRAVAAPMLPLQWRGQFFRVLARSKSVKTTKAQLSPELKAALTEELRDDILALQSLIDRDLSGWLVNE